MELLIFLKRLFFDNWQRKIVSLLTAIVIWLLVNGSITVTKTIPNVPVRIVNIPQNKTVEGLLSNGYLSQRITLTVSGNKQVIQELDANNLQVVINADDKGDQWIAKVDKKALVSTNPEIDLSRAIHDISQNEFVIRLSPLTTEKIPIVISEPMGESPTGYQFLDVWPQNLYQQVSGPEEQVNALKMKGLELTFDLSKITPQDLDAIHNHSKATHDEVSFLVPPSWKKVAIDFPSEAFVEINDPLAQHLRIDFLHRSFLPLDVYLPISIFFPLQYSALLNPETYSLAQSPTIEEIYGINVLKIPLFAKGVSKQFLDIVRNNLQIIVIASPIGEGEPLSWTLQIVDAEALENSYVNAAMAEESDSQDLQRKLKEEYLRSRFRIYTRELELHTTQDKKLKLQIEFDDTKVIVRDVSS